MTEIPPNPVTMDEVALWYKTKLEIKKLQTLENLLRPKIFKHFFPDPREGVNSAVLPDSYVIKGTRVISRDVDIGAVNAFRMPGPNGEPSQFEQHKINIDNYLRTKYELKVAEYRKLTEEEIKLIDQCLIIKDGMPQLDIVPPSNRK